MGSFTIAALSPHVPADDAARLDEGGADAAAAALTRLFPDRHYELRGSGALIDPVGEDEVAVSTFGPTVLAWHELADELPEAPGRGDLDSYQFCYSTVSMSGSYEVQTAAGTRLVAPDEDRTIHSGDPLPFEAAHFDADGTIDDPAALLTDAMLWMFGYDPSGDTSRDRFDAAALPVHRFAQT